MLLSTTTLMSCITPFITEHFYQNLRNGIDPKDADLYQKSVHFLQIPDYNESLLNTIEPFTSIQPTSENIAKVIFDRLKSQLNANEIRLKQVRVWESPTNSASYSDAVLAV